MDSIGVQHMREVLAQQLAMAEKSDNYDAIMYIKVIEDEFIKTFSYLE